MKKLLIIIFCLFITGCNNYRELNNIAVVSALGIDYRDNKYEVSALIKDNTKDGKDKSSIYSYDGKSLDEAIQKVGLLTSKTLYFIDLNVLVLTENATYKLQSIMDYLSRENNVGINFYILCDNHFKESFKMMQDKDNVYGDYVKGILQNNYNNVVRIKYTPFLQKFLSPYYDVILPVGHVSNNDYLIDKAIIFSDKKDVTTINFDNIQIYNILNNSNMTYLFNSTIDSKNFIFKAMKVKSKINYQNNRFIIEINASGILDEMEDINLDDKETVQRITNITKEKITNETNKFINTLTTNDSDIFGFKKIYYNKKRTKPHNIKNINYEVKVKVSLNRKGLIFYSLGGEYEKDK